MYLFSSHPQWYKGTQTKNDDIQVVGPVFNKEGMAFAVEVCIPVNSLFRFLLLPIIISLVIATTHIHSFIHSLILILLLSIQVGSFYREALNRAILTLQRNGVKAQLRDKWFKPSDTEITSDNRSLTVCKFSYILPIAYLYIYLYLSILYYLFLSIDWLIPFLLCFLCCLDCSTHSRDLCGSVGLPVDMDVHRIHCIFDQTLHYQAASSSRQCLHYKTSRSYRSRGGDWLAQQQQQSLFLIILPLWRWWQWSRVGTSLKKNILYLLSPLSSLCK